MGALAGMADRDLADVIASATSGDEAAFRHLIRAYHEDMRRVCCYVTRDEAVADEATQAAWSIAWRKVGTVRNPASVRPWLVSIAVNEAKRILRKQRRRQHFELVREVADVPGGTDPATGVAAIDLHMALEHLDPDDRALLAMRYVAGFNSNELAEAIGITPVGTRQRLKRLLDRLRQELLDG